jgi:hypothetical protein
MTTKPNSLTKKTTGTKEKREYATPYEKLRIADKLDAIAGWIMQGKTDDNIAEMLGVCRKTVFNWKTEHPEFATCFIKTKQIRLGELIKSAFKQATGYDYTEDVISKTTGEVVSLRKHQPGNATLVMFMLQNHLPDEYRDMRNIDVGGTVTIKVVEDGNNGQ